MNIGRFGLYRKKIVSAKFERYQPASGIFKTSQCINLHCYQQYRRDTS